MKQSKKTLKGALSLILAIALCCSLVVPAMAASVTVAKNDDGHAYNIGGYEGEKVAQTFKATASADLTSIDLWLARNGKEKSKYDITVQVNVYYGSALSDGVLASSEIKGTSNSFTVAYHHEKYTASFAQPVHLDKDSMYVFEVVRTNGDYDIQYLENYNSYGDGAKYDYSSGTYQEAYSRILSRRYDMRFVINGNTDETPPTIPSVSIASSNSNTAFAKVGDTVTLSFTASEALAAAPTVTIANQAATVVKGSGNDYTAVYTMTNSTADGTITFSIRSFSDIAGNAGAEVQATTDSSSVTFDKTSPTVPTVTNSTAWTNAASVPVTITPGTDSGSGVDKVMYQLSEATPPAWIEYATAFDITTAGITTINAYTVDNAGNVSSTVSSTVNIDRTIPTIGPVTLDPTEYTNGTVKLTVTASDVGSGIAPTGGYSFDGGTHWQDTNNKTVDANGTVSIQVKDATGNLSSVTNVPVNNIDKVAPTINSVTSDPVPGTYTNGSVTLTVEATDVTADATDVESGIATTNGYRFNGGLWQSNNTVTVSVPGPCTIEVKDAAGNIASTTFTVNNIDTTAPAMTLSKSPAGPTNGDVTITPNATDSGSSVDTESYKWAPGAQTVGFFTTGGTVFTTGSFDVSENGTYTVFAMDNAGNPVTAAIDITNIDKTPPTVTLDLADSQAPTAYSTPVNFKVTFSEGVTGFSAADVTVSGSAGATSATVTGSGTTYNVAVSGVTGEGTITIDVATGAAVDLAGNPNIAPAVIRNTVTCTSAALSNVTVGAQNGSVISETPGSVTYTLAPEWNGTNIFGDYQLGIVWDSSVPAGAPAGVTSLFEYVLSTSYTRVHKLTITTDPTTMEGTYKFTVQATQGSTVISSADVTFIVGAPGKTDPVIAWPTPDAITYGNALGTAQQTASASVEGTFAYGYSDGDILTAGTHTLTAVFTPTDKRHYNPVVASVQITVNKAPLTITANDASRVYGQPNPTFTYSINGFVNSDTETKAISGTPMLTCAANSSSSAGTPYAINVDLTGVTSLNYSITPVSGQLTITKATYTEFVFPAGTLMYGQTLGQAVLTGGSYLGSYTFNSSTDTPSVSDSGTAYAATFVPQDSNYATMTGTIVVTVNPATLTVTAKNLEKFYGEANPTLEYVITGYVKSEGASVITNSPVLTCSALETTSVSIVPITVNTDGMLAENYTFTHVDGTLTIKQATPVITWNPSAITYGTEIDDTLNASLQVPGSFVYTTLPNGTVVTNGTILDRGTYTLKVTFLPDDGTNYTTAEKTVSLTVNPATLTVTADNKSITYGGAIPTFTASYSGFVPGEDEMVLNGTLSITTTAGSLSPAGTYPITPSGQTSNNYAISYVDGTLTINRKAITGMTIDPIANQLYTGSAIEPDVTVPGLASGDYDVEYKDNILPGTATLEVTGKSNYDGTISTTFSIYIPYYFTTDNDNTATAAGNINLRITTVGNRTTIATDLPGTSTASLEAAYMQAIIDAAKPFEEAGQLVIAELYVPEATSGTLAMTVSGALLKNLADGTTAALKVGGPLGSLRFDPDAFDSLVTQVGTATATFSINKIPSATISTLYPQYADKTVYDISVMAGSTKLTTFGGGEVTVTMPYTPAAGEDASNIVIYYLSTDGVVMMQHCVYDADSGTVSFTTDHLSLFAVGYKSDTAFSDISGWYVENVNYLAERGVMGGVGDGLFDPEGNITRGQFVKILANLAGADLSTYTTSTFSDVKTTDWFFGAVEWAYANDIANGTSGKFNPDASISRQDLAVMLMRYADLVDFTLPVTVDEMTFADSDMIADYAVDAVAAMQRAGVISGIDGSFAPASGATRAQAAKMIATFMQAMINF